MNRRGPKGTSRGGTKHFTKTVSKGHKVTGHDFRFKLMPLGEDLRYFKHVLFGT